MIEYRDISDWVFQTNDDGRVEFAYRYLLDTDPMNTDNRIAAIEMTPRVQIFAPFAVQHKSEVFAETICSDDDIRSIWYYGYKGDGPEDPDSLAWCDALLKALYPDE